MQKCSLTAKLDCGVAGGGPVLKDSAEDASNSAPPPNNQTCIKDKRSGICLPRAWPCPQMLLVQPRASQGRCVHSPAAPVLLSSPLQQPDGLPVGTLRSPKTQRKRESRAHTPSVCVGELDGPQLTRQAQRPLGWGWGLVTCRTDFKGRAPKT